MGKIMEAYATCPILRINPLPLIAAVVFSCVVSVPVVASVTPMGWARNAPDASLGKMSGFFAYDPVRTGESMLYIWPRQVLEFPP